jgi:dihydrofolate synthase/folylpolyglutamate synthase
MVTATTSKAPPRKPARKLAIRTYDAAVKYLFAQTDYEQMLRVRYNRDTFSLTRMRSLLKKLGDPHKSLRCAHIAGTKGKGSTATMLAEMLQACGYKVGLYTSPHLVDIRERITVNGEMITQAALTRLINKVAVPVERMSADKPTFFEIFTAIAFLHFAQLGVDVVVLETGLGGRLDSTNVVKPMVVGLTSISIDHTHQLGETVAAIAGEKAGVFKSGVPAVSVPQPPEAKSVLAKAARAANSKLLFTGEHIDFSYRFESSRETGPQTRVCLTTESSQFEHLPVPLMGEHQALNCGLALAMLDQLKAQGMQIDDRAAMRGLARVRLPGRMEILAQHPRILVDGAHNAASVEALMRAIGQYIPYDSMVVVFGCAADKDIDGMLDEILRGADKVIFTRYDSPRAVRPEDLAEKYEECSGKTAQVAPDLKEAVRVAANAVSREDLICITGSFYLVGEAKKLLGS